MALALGDRLALAQAEAECAGDRVEEAQGLALAVVKEDGEGVRVLLWQPDVETVRVGDAVLLVEAEPLAVRLNE